MIEQRETVTITGNNSNATQFSYGFSLSLLAKAINLRRHSICKEAMNLPQWAVCHFIQFFHLEIISGCVFISSSIQCVVHHCETQKGLGFNWTTELR